MNLKEPKVCKIREYHIPFERPLGITVALTGDWHVSPIVGRTQEKFLAESLKKIKPDLVLLQGDLFDSPAYFKDAKLRAKLIRELKICAELAPTVMVLGNHDILYPGGEKFKNFSEFEKHKVFPRAVESWRELCDEAGVRLLADEWFEFGKLRIFGFFEDEKCCFNGGKWGENLEKVSEKLSALKRSGKMIPDPCKINWFLSHAPLRKLAKNEELSGFKIMSFGHTHGGCVPRGIDELFDIVKFHGGFYAPFGRLFPLTQMRGITKLPGDRKLIVNTGMVFTQQCAPKLLHNLNFLKAAEITKVIL